MEAPPTFAIRGARWDAEPLPVIAQESLFSLTYFCSAVNSLVVYFNFWFKTSFNSYLPPLRFNCRRLLGLNPVSFIEEGLWEEKSIPGTE